MAEAEIDHLAELLRRRVSRSLGWPCAPQGAGDDVLHRLIGRGQDVALFGGAARDLMATATAVPRDLDLVIGASDDKGITAILGEGKRNRFGGRRLTVVGREIDVWPLARTWAFRYIGVGLGGFEDLPRTTFLNVEAIAARLDALGQCRLWAWDNQFFRAFLDRKVEINLEENPSPVGCVARSLVTASRLGFSLGPRLVAYIDHHLGKAALEELVELQRSHYGKVILSGPHLALIRSVVRGHLRSRRSFPLRLFGARRSSRLGDSLFSLP